MHMEEFTTDACPAPQRPRAWREALYPHSLRPEMVLSTQPPYGSLTAWRRAVGVGPARITSSAQTLRRLGNEADAI